MKNGQNFPLVGTNSQFVCTGSLNAALAPQTQLPFSSNVGHKSPFNNEGVSPPHFQRDRAKQRGGFVGGLCATQVDQGDFHRGWGGLFCHFYTACNYITKVDPQLSEPTGRHTIGSDMQGVLIGEMESLSAKKWVGVGNNQ